jgi:phospholipid/cholesterol/gamma-HCH transport system ATP-binding protein
MDAAFNTNKFEDEIVMSISGLCKSFGNNVVLNDFNVTLKYNQNIVVLGRSGSGKSVLIKCIIGLLKHDQGKILLFDKEVSSLDNEALDQLRAKVGFLFQSNALYDSMTVRENLEFPLRRHWIKHSPSEVDALIKEALSDVGLLHTIDMMPVALSGGMRKRIALARTLILKPAIILYDEPTTGLDTITSKEIIQLIISIKQKYHTSALIISHDMNCVKLASDLVIILLDGKCYACDTYENLMHSHDEKIKQFFE